MIILPFLIVGDLVFFCVAVLVGAEATSPTESS